MNPESSTPTSAAPLLEVSHLAVRFGDGPTAVQDVSFTVDSGQTVAIVGESGSGKSVSSMAVGGLLPSNAHVTGSVRLRGVELPDDPRSRRNAASGSLAYIFQDPVNALDPLFTIGDQLRESVRARAGRISRRAATEAAIGLLEMVRMPDPRVALRKYPHQFSGGQCQRIMIAMALAAKPELLIADEPTTALDVTVQQEILNLLRTLGSETGMGILIITHDMGVVADMADTVVVLRSGNVVEESNVFDLFDHPTAEYTRMLLDAVPRMRELDSPDAAPGIHDPHPILEVDNLQVVYGKSFRAVQGVDFTLALSECVGLVGESGSGKSTIAKAIYGAAAISAGTVTFSGVDLAAASRREQIAARRSIGVVFQNPTASLDPRYTVGQTLRETLRLRGMRSRAEIERAARDAMDMVELPASWTDRYPHELSGGQRQRVAIARALVIKPSLLIADEPTSALDVSVQAAILNLLRELQQELGFGCLFVSHDLAVVDELAHRVLVLQGGRLVEEGLTGQVLRSPRDPYTQTLVAASPVPDPRQQRARHNTAA